LILFAEIALNALVAADGLVGSLAAFNASYFARSSPIFAFRNDIGILLTRISSRFLSPCAWRAYCARSFRARSVTEYGSASSLMPNQRNCKRKPLTLELQIVN
jgi:hypothetical protein